MPRLTERTIETKLSRAEEFCQEAESRGLQVTNRGVARASANTLRTIDLARDRLQPFIESSTLQYLPHGEHEKDHPETEDAARVIMVDRIVRACEDEATTIGGVCISDLSDTAKKDFRDGLMRQMHTSLWRSQRTRTFMKEVAEACGVLVDISRRNDETEAIYRANADQDQKTIDTLTAEVVKKDETIAEIRDEFANQKDVLLGIIAKKDEQIEKMQEIAGMIAQQMGGGGGLRPIRD